MTLKKTLGKSKTLVLKWLVVSLLSLIVIPLFIPFGVYTSTLKLLSTHLSGYKTFKKLNYIENNFYIVTARFNYPVEIIINYGKSFFVSKDSLNINMSWKDYEKLDSRILLAKQRGRITREDKNVEVDATISVKNNQLVKASVRLKGTYLDHAIGDKWSFRIKLKNKKTLYGMNRFSLHNPLTRMWLSEWLYQKALRYSDLMYLEYKFVDLHINGKYIGIYALEEFMHANLIKKNKRMDGILLRGNKFLFNRKQMEENKKLRYIYNEYELIFNKYEKDEIKISDFYDLEKLAKHFAVTQIFGSGHSHLEGNWITYYNPFRKKVEVIGYDSNSGRYLKDAKLQIEPGAVFYFKDSHIKKIFKDKDFIRHYLYYISKYAQKEYFSRFFDISEMELLEQINIIRRVKPWQVVDQYEEIIYSNQDYILEYFARYINDYQNILDGEILNFMKEHSIEPHKYNNLNYEGVEFFL